MSGVAPFAVGAVTLPTDPSIQVSGSLNQAGGHQLYEVSLDTQGLLAASVHAPGLNTVLSIEDDSGNILLQSEATSPTDPDDRLEQQLPAGTYYLSVSGMTGVGSFALSTTFTPAISPGESITETHGAYGVTTADLNGDGVPDLIVPDYYDGQILINDGVGDGTFQPPVAIPVGSGPRDVLAADLSGDGPTDLVVVDQLSNDIMILDGDGHGHYQVSQVLPTPAGPVAVVSGDFSGDGLLDLAVAVADGVEIFKNRGEGIFAPAGFIGSIGDPTALAVANLNGDARPDLAVASAASGDLVLLAGEGNDQFAPIADPLFVGPGCSDVIAANLSGGGLPDLVAVSPISGMISIFGDNGSGYELQETLEAGTSPQAVVAADFNGDGHLDLAAVNYGSNNVSVFLGNGDGTFGAATDDATGSGPIGLAAADVNKDGFPELVTSNFIGLTVSVLINNHDGTFRSPPLTPPSAGPEDVVVADVNGDGIPDLLVPDFALDEVSIFLGRGDGTFRDPIEVPAGSGPKHLAVGDFTGDGIADLAVSDTLSDSVMILKGNGDGTFQEIATLATDKAPQFIETADLDGDGHLDLVVANYLGNDVDIFYGEGAGKFSSPVAYPVGAGPSGIAISDLNGDGLPDIAVSNSGSNDLDILLATGRRSYAAPIVDPAGDQPWEVTAGDFNDDGHPDLIVADGLSSPTAVSLLLNNGNGTFQPPATFGVGGSPFPLTIGDFNGDGNLDVVTGNVGSNDLSVLLGNGNGTFRPEDRLAGGLDPYGVAVGDFNRDGHLDIVSANFQSSNLMVYFGNGDGTFETTEPIPIVSPNLPTITADLEGNGVPQVLVANPEAGTITVFNSQGDGTLQLITTVDVGGSPSGMVVGDFNGDGRPDLAVTDAQNGKVLILLGLGDGTFQSPVAYAVGKSPRSPVVGDFTHDGILDIAVADTDSNQVSVLFGRGNGTFLPQVAYQVGHEPLSLVVGYATANGYLDLGAVDRSSHDITELLGEPGGIFVTETVDLSGISPSDLVTGDFNGDGVPDLVIEDELRGQVDFALDLATGPRPIVSIDVGVGKVYLAAADLYHTGEDDLIVANADTNVVTILSDWSNNTFENRYTFQVDGSIAGLSVVDLNKDGLPDILITEAGTGQIETYLSSGNGVFSAAESTVALPHPAPIIFGLSSGVSDIINIDNTGNLLNRVGVPGAMAQFEAPINETNGRGVNLRDFTFVQTGGIPDVVSLDTQRNVIYVQNTVDSGPSGETILSLPGQGTYTRLISGDLFGNGLDDLVAINHTLDEIVIFRQTSSGVFSQYGEPISAGFGPTDVTLADLNPGGLPDLVVADGSSGEVTLIARDSLGGFFDAAMLPAGLAVAGTVLLPNGLQRISPDEPVGVASGVFGPSGLADVAVVDRGTDQISILQGLADGGLAAPSLALTFSTGLDPIQVVAADLTNNGLLDLVVLNEGSHDISIFLNNGHGGFTALPRVDAGDNPTALAVRDVTGDGLPDLVVSNITGDVLILAGNGNGTFQPYQRADGTVNLAVGDLNGNGQNEFVLTNTAQDLLTVQDSSFSPGFLQGRGDGLLAPGPVEIADMNGDGIPDLIVTNTGGNDVFVYLGLGHDKFAAPLRFYTGTAPVGLTVAHLTDNGLPDLVVANSGSNDITILLGEFNSDGSWTMVPGPRLKAGDRPVSTTVTNIFGDPDGDQDIVVVNENSDTVTILRGLGSGFFDDVNPLTLATGESPVEAFVGHFSSSTRPGLVVLNSMSNDMTYYRALGAPEVTIASGGIDPVSGVMGDFNRDGFSDLAVADNGDSQITLFDGGPSGLILAQTIFLDPSTRPTDLVVSGSQFFVGAEGDDHAIPISFSSLETIDSTVSTQADSGFARVFTGNFSSSGAYNSTLLEASTNALSAQSVESAQAGASISGPAGTFGAAVAMVTTLAQTIQPLFSPSSNTVGWLIDNLAQLAQGQTAEMLPFGKNDMAAIAVLMSTSNVAMSHDERGNFPLAPANEGDTPIVVALTPDRAGRSSPSRLDRFVANLGDSPFDANRAGESTDRVPEFGPDWVWHRRPTDPASNTASFDREPSSSSPSRHPDPPANIAAVADKPPIVTGNDAAEFLDGQEGSFLLRFTLNLAGLISLAVGIVAATAFEWRIPINALKRLAKPFDRKRLPERSNERERVGTTWPSSRSRASLDLPPWLQEQASFRLRQTDRTSISRRWKSGPPGTP